MLFHTESFFLFRSPMQRSDNGNTFAITAVVKKYQTESYETLLKSNERMLKEVVSSEQKQPQGVYLLRFIWLIIVRIHKH